MDLDSSKEEAIYRKGIRIAELASQASAIDLSTKQVMAIARDVLPEYPILLDALLYTISRPEFSSLAAESHAALLQAKKDSLINSLVEIFTPLVISQLSSLLDGLLGIKRSSRENNYSESHFNDTRQSPPSSIGASQATRPDDSGIQDPSLPSETSLTAARQRLADINIAAQTSAKAKGISIVAAGGFGVLTVIALFVVQKNARLQNSTSRIADSSDCNTQKTELEQEAMALPSYTTIENDIYFTNLDGSVLSPWKAGGQTWQAVYSALTYHDDSRPKSPSSAQLAFINNAKAYKERCGQ